jgi:hypothetical protein
VTILSGVPVPGRRQQSWAQEREPTAGLLQRLQAGVRALEVAVRRPREPRRDSDLRHLDHVWTEHRPASVGFVSALTQAAPNLRWRGAPCAEACSPPRTSMATSCAAASRGAGGGSAGLRRASIIRHTAEAFAREARGVRGGPSTASRLRGRRSCRPCCKPCECLMVPVQEADGTLRRSIPRPGSQGRHDVPHRPRTFTCSR